ncbi:unnamed protein product [Dibothriocephalus latus]|uniref:Uncharacterized protein n=1 Tax=Dibothriocephalus latus TaxID=60516 RepID=A0A3P6RHK0_DIBLA|nr:unnamed protein product [Dibothriocephalus latus]
MLQSFTHGNELKRLRGKSSILPPPSFEHPSLSVFIKMEYIIIIIR